MKLFDKEIELEHEYRIEGLPAGNRVIDYHQMYYDVIHSIRDVFPYYGGYRAFVDQMLPVIGMEVGRQIFVHENEEYEGDLSYRIRKYLELHNIRLGEMHRQILNSKIAYYSQQRFQNVIAMFSETIDWDSGDFHESSDSCWWDNRYSNGKAAFMWHMKHGGGFSIRLWDAAGDPLGRSFAVRVPDSEDVVLFNIYVARGFANTDFLNLFSGFLNAQHRQVPLRLYTHGTGAIYINGDIGFRYSKRKRNLKEADRVHILLTEYNRPFDPEIEALRLSPSRFPDQKMCNICNRYTDRGLYFVKPQKREMCSDCLNREGILVIGPTYKNGEQTYYDRAYYKRSKNDYYKFVRIAGKKWEQAE